MNLSSMTGGFGIPHHVPEESTEPTVTAIGRACYCCDKDTIGVKDAADGLVPAGFDDTDYAVCGPCVAVWR